MTNLNHLLSLIQTDYTTIRVVLDGKGKKYTYKCHDLSIKCDDYVVVLLPDEQLHVGKVAGVDEVPNIDETATFDYKWIVCKIGLEEYKARCNGETAFYKAIEKANHEKKRENAIEHLKGLGVTEASVKTLAAAILPPNEITDVEA